jgi:hypothetical protein
MRMRLALVAVSLCGLACSSKTENGGSGGSRAGGDLGTGGVVGGTGAGGTTASGGSAGGTTATSTGGSAGGTLAGGSSAAGGVASGGSAAGGSAGGSGGIKPPGTGGAASGGTSGTGGTSDRGTGGTSDRGTGGATRAGGSVGPGTGGSGTGGGGPATGGSTSAGGSTGSAVVPTVASSGRNRFAWGDVIFEVDPKVGARVGKLSLGGADMVVSSGTATDQTDWGAVFWTSPQSAWATNWPAPAEIDRNAYTGGISGTHVLLDSASYASLGVSVSKDFSADATTGWITVIYTIKASKAVQAAPWENCRVPRGGLAFFPSGTSLAKGPLTLTESGGIVWFDDKAKTATSPSGDKAVADGSGGWMAYALDGNLLLRKFTDTPASALAPKEGDVEIYPGSGFLELEVQGPYTSLVAGGKLSWTVAWRIAKIPSTVTVSAGSTTLADFAKQQAGL